MWFRYRSVAPQMSRNRSAAPQNSGNRSLAPHNSRNRSLTPQNVQKSECGTTDSPGIGIQILDPGYRSLDIKVRESGNLGNHNMLLPQPMISQFMCSCEELKSHSWVHMLIFNKSQRRSRDFGVCESINVGIGVRIVWIHFFSLNPFL